VFFERAKIVNAIQLFPFYPPVGFLLSPSLEMAAVFTGFAVDLS
jgi:hypothetical protein